MTGIKIDVKVFSGKTVDEAAEKANNYPVKLQAQGSFKASHVLQDGNEFKIIIVTTHIE